MANQQLEKGRGGKTISYRLTKLLMEALGGDNYDDSSDNTNSSLQHVSMTMLLQSL